MHALARRLSPIATRVMALFATAGSSGATQDQRAIEAIKAHAVKLSGGDADFDSIMEAIGDAPVVMIGEPSHGTHEAYRIRNHLARRLITEKGFDIVAWESDLPDALQVSRWVRGYTQGTASDALSGFHNRFPTWM